MTQSERLSATKLRQNLYATLDFVIQNGAVVKVSRHGHDIYISAEPETYLKKLKRLRPHHTVVGKRDELVHYSPSQWQP